MKAVMSFSSFGEGGGCAMLNLSGRFLDELGSTLINGPDVSMHLCSFICKY